jgi:FtsH-binding integral membrane protein
MHSGKGEANVIELRRWRILRLPLPALRLLFHSSGRAAAAAAAFMASDDGALSANAVSSRLAYSRPLLLVCLCTSLLSSFFLSSEPSKDDHVEILLGLCI